MADNIDPHAAEDTSSPAREQTRRTGSEDDVLDMIAEMESRLGRLKSAKAAEQQRLSALAEREQRLAEQARTLEHLREELKTRQAEHERRQQDLAEARQAFEVEQQSLRETQQAVESQQQRNEEQLQTLQALEAEVEARERKLCEGREEIERIQQHAAEREKELAALRSSLEEAKDQARIFEETAAYEQEQRQHLEQAVAGLEREQAAAEEKQAASEQELIELRAELEAARKAEQETRDALHQAQSDLAAAQSRRESAEAGLQAARAQLEERSGELTAAKAACENLESDLQSRQEAFDAERAALKEAADASAAELDSLQKQVEALTAERDESLQRAIELQTELSGLQQAHGAATQAHADALEQARSEAQEQIEQARQALERQRSQLEAAKGKLREFAEVIDEQTDATEQVVYLRDQIDQQQKLISELRLQAQQPGAAGENDAESAELRARIADLSAQLDEAQQECAALRRQLDAAAASPGGPAEELLARQLRERDAQLDELKRRLEEARQAAASVDEAHIAQLHQQIARLQQQLDEARALDPSDVPQELAGQAQQLAELHRQMRTRRARLQRQKELLADRSEKLLSVQQVLQQRHQQYEEVLAEKNAIADLKKKLSTAEVKLIAKWAAARGTIVAMLTMLTLLVLAAASYGVAYKFAPATFVASCVIKPEHPAGERIGPDERAAWATALQGMAASDPVLKAAADRMGQRGFADLDQPAELQQYLSRNLVAEVQADGLLRLELQVPSRYPAERVLDTYAVALMQVANAMREQRPDGYTSRLASAPAAEGEPVSDERLLFAGYVFGGATVVMGLLCVGIRRSYAKAKPVFDLNDETFDLHSEMKPPL